MAAIIGRTVCSVTCRSNRGCRKRSRCARYASGGRPSIAPERRLRALLLQVHSQRTAPDGVAGRQPVVPMVRGLECRRAVSERATFSKNHDRLLECDVARRLFEQVLFQAKAAGRTIDEHFSVDGTLSDMQRRACGLEPFGAVHAVQKTFAVVPDFAEISHWLRRLAETMTKRVI